MKIVFALLLLAMSTSKAVADPTVARGYNLLNVNCASCHAIGVNGNSPHPEAPPFHIVMKSYPAESLSEALAEGLITGHPDMPEFVFPPEDVGAIVSYLQTLEGLE